MAVSENLTAINIGSHRAKKRRTSESNGLDPTPNLFFSSDLLQSLETCGRQAVWSRQWEAVRLHHTEVLYRAIKAGVTERERTDYGEVAGEWVMGFAADRGIEMRSHQVYDTTIHFACLADILTTYLRGDIAWEIPEPIDMWHPRCYLLDGRLVRIILVDHWSDDRLAAECHSWRTLGEMAHYRLPMTLKIMVIGAHRESHRHSYWTKGFLNRKFPNTIRFKATGRNNSRQEPFMAVHKIEYRENMPQFTSASWIKAMKEQRVDEEVALTYPLEALSEERISQVHHDYMLERARFMQFGDLPQRRYGVCDWPRPCPFLNCCWGSQEVRPPDVAHFVRLDTL